MNQNNFSTPRNKIVLSTSRNTDKLLVCMGLSFWSYLRVWVSSFSGHSAPTAPVWEPGTAGWHSCCDHTVCVWLGATWVRIRRCRALWRNFSLQPSFQVDNCQLSPWWPLSHPTPPPSHPRPQDLRTDPRTLCLLGKHFTSELTLQPLPLVTFSTLYF